MQIAVSFRSSNQCWRNECSKHSPGELPDGTVFSLLVEDPRLSRPLKKIKRTETNGCSTKSLNIDNLPLPLGDFWDFETRRRVGFDIGFLLISSVAK